MNRAQIELLVIDAQSGDRNALDTLYRHFSQPMRKYAFVRVNNAMTADDLVQNVWLKVAKRIRFLNDVSLFRSWLYKALRWEITDWFRAPQNRVASDDTVSELGTDSPIVKELELFSTLAVLGEQERETTELFYLYELSIREISLVTNVPEGTVKSRLHRARAQLRTALNISA